MKPIVIVGSINIDFVMRVETNPSPGQTVLGTDFETHPGGKGANQAVAAARLGYPVEMIGCIGSDGFGERLRGDLRGVGVGTDGVQVAPGSSGVATITVSKTGQNSIVIFPGANTAVTPAFVESQRAQIENAGIVLAQLEIPMDTVEALATICRRAAVPLMLDPAPARPISRELMQQVSWFTPNDTESLYYGALFGCDQDNPSEAAERFLMAGAQGVVLKMGARGALIAYQKGERAHLQPFPVQVVDTTAAGDAFNGAFATGLMLGMAPAEAGRFAGAAAALSVTRRGAQPSMPNREDVEALMIARSD